MIRLFEELAGSPAQQPHHAKSGRDANPCRGHTAMKSDYKQTRRGFRVPVVVCCRRGLNEL
jgi:hypothetical protein